MKYICKRCGEEAVVRVNKLDIWRFSKKEITNEEWEQFINRRHENAAKMPQNRNDIQIVCFKCHNVERLLWNGEKEVDGDVPKGTPN